MGCFLFDQFTGFKNAVLYVERKGKKLKTEHDNLFKSFVVQPGSSKQAVDSLEKMKLLEEAENLVQVPAASFMLFIENERRENMVSGQKERRSK